MLEYLALVWNYDLQVSYVYHYIDLKVLVDPHNTLKISLWAIVIINGQKYVHNKGNEDSELFLVSNLNHQYCLYLSSFI